MRYLVALCLSLVSLSACEVGDEEPREVVLEQVGYDEDWAHVVSGPYDSCATKADGSAWCFSNRNGHWTEYADLHFTRIPERLEIEHDVVDFAINAKHACALTTTGRLFCWGNNNYGQIGIGAITQPAQREAGEVVETPAEVKGGGKWLSVAAGLRHTCGVKDDHSLWCWGDRVTDATIIAGDISLGGSGFDVTNEGMEYAFLTSEPTLIDAKRKWASVIARGEVTCGVTTGGKMSCALLQNHENEFPAVGSKVEHIGIRLRTVLQEVPWATLSLGGHFSCGVGLDASMWCWETLNEPAGYFEREINMEAPTEYGNSPWAHVSAGSEDICGLSAKGRLWCYTGGKRETDDEEYKIYFLPVARRSAWMDVSVGGTETCAIKITGAMWCWKSYCDPNNKEGVCL